MNLLYKFQIYFMDTQLQLNLPKFMLFREQFFVGFGQNNWA